MAFSHHQFLRWTRGSTLVAEPDAIPEDALRIAQNVRLDRVLGAITNRPGWTRVTPGGPFAGPIVYLSKLFLKAATYTYVQVNGALLRLGATFVNLGAVVQLGTTLVSDASSPDGNGALWKYFANDASVVKDNGTVAYNVGIGQAPTPPLSAQLAPDLFTQIDAMDTAANWTGGNLATGPSDDGTIFVTPPGSVTFSVNASTVGIIAQAIALNLDTLAGGDATVKNDDYLFFWLRVDNPANVTFIQLDFDIDVNTTAVSNAFVRQQFTVQLPALTTLNQGAFQWTKVQVRKSAFARIGADATRGWSTVRAVRLLVQTNSFGAVNVWIDDLKLRGGIGLEGTIQYTVCYRSSLTMGRGNPPTDSQGVVQFTAPLFVDRQQVLLTIGNVQNVTGGDPQITTLMLWRLGGVFTTPALVASIAMPGSGFYTDVTSDQTLVLTNKFLETDNDTPPGVGKSRVMFGPDGAGHLYLIVDGTLLYMSKAYETLENRADNWPKNGYVIVGDGTARALAGAATGTQVKVWTGARTFNVVGVGIDTILPVPQDGSHGIVGSKALCTGAGVFFFVSQDGIWDDINGVQTKLTGAIDPFFEGRTVDGQLGWNTDPAMMAKTQLQYLHEPTGHTLVMLYVEAGYADLAKSLTLKPNLQTGKLTEAFFDASVQTPLQSLYLDPTAGQLLAGGYDGHVYRIEDPTTDSDAGTGFYVNALTKSTDFGTPKNLDFIAHTQFEGSTSGQQLTAIVRYNRNAQIERPGTFSTQADVDVGQLPTANPQALVHDAAIGFFGLSNARVAITRMGLFYEDQPELLTFLDSSTVTFPFVHQLKRFQIDITAPSTVTLALYIDTAPPRSFPLIPTVGRQTRPFALPAGLRGSTFRVTLTTTGQPFLCYDVLGFFKRLGVDEEYRRVSILGEHP